MEISEEVKEKYQQLVIRRKKQIRNMIFPSVALVLSTACMGGALTYNWTSRTYQKYFEPKTENIIGSNPKEEETFIQTPDGERWYKKVNNKSIEDYLK